MIRPRAIATTLRGDLHSAVLVVVAFLLILVVFPLVLIAAGP
jgi:hypothetical protein